MNMLAWIRRETRYLRRLIRLLIKIKPVDPASPNLVCDDLEASVRRWPERIAIELDDQSLTYAQLDALANRFAHWGLAQGLKRGDTVALFLPNRIDYVACWFGLSKIGAISALINYSLAGNALAHCIRIAEAKALICDPTTLPSLSDSTGAPISDLPLWCLDLKADGPVARALSPILDKQSETRPERSLRRGMTAHDVAMYIYTSGTTGLPKAAKVSHIRAQLYMRAFSGMTEASQTDRVYIALPLYHSTGGLCGVGAALMSGGAMVLKRKFSASQFWDDIIEKQCTMFVYIGELCRYLINQPPSPKEKQHKLRLIFGNGLRPDVWEQFDARFGITDVVEFYGSTEGNVQVLNLDGKTGAVGRVPAYLKSQFNIRLVRFNFETEEPERDANGRCIPCKPGEVGEAIGLIKQDARHNFSGYADKAASEKKILRHVYALGDQWFRTGDLMKQDEDGYFYFVDRVGDTFRWKGENVSTLEVAEHLTGVPGLLETTVYGVPVGQLEGKAGMVALVVTDGFDLKQFAAHVDRCLPVFARPVFVRLLQDLETTGTFKYRKVDLVRDGFDPAKTEDPLFVRDGDTYRPITADLHPTLVAPGYRY